MKHLYSAIYTCLSSIFNALHGTQTQSSDENSVCRSVKRVDCDKTEKISVQIFISYERSFGLVFWEEEWSVGAAPVAPQSFIKHSEKSSINTNRKCTTRFPMSPRWTSCVVRKSPKGAQKRKVSKIWTISCDNSETVKIGRQLQLITNMKSHTGFWLIPTSMTLNGVTAPILRFFYRIWLLCWPITSQWLKIDL